MYSHKTDRTPRTPVRIALTRHSASHYSATRGTQTRDFRRMDNGGWGVSQCRGAVWGYARPTLALALLTAFRAPAMWEASRSVTVFAGTAMEIGDFVAIDYGHGIRWCHKLPEPKTDAESTQLAQLRAIAQDAFELRERTS